MPAVFGCSIILPSNSLAVSFTERLSLLLPEEAQEQTATVAASHDFEPAYRLDCKNLCADFQEDIQFRFSLGITSLMHRFLGQKGTKAVLMGYSDAVSSISHVSSHG